MAGEDWNPAGMLLTRLSVPAWGYVHRRKGTPFSKLYRVPHGQAQVLSLVSWQLCL